MKLTDLRLPLFLAGLLLPASLASADNLAAGSGWQSFEWSNCTNLPCSTTPTSWILTTPATGRIELRVVDAYTAGEMFQVQVTPYPPTGGTLNATSSWVPLTTLPEYLYAGYYSPLVVQDDADQAWSIPKYFSRFAVELPPGNTYTITIMVTQLAHDPETYGLIRSGGAYIRATCLGPVGSGCPADTVSPFVTNSAAARTKRSGSIPPFTINGAPVGKSPAGVR